MHQEASRRDQQMCDPRYCFFVVNVKNLLNSHLSNSKNSESENTPAEFIVLHEPKFEIFLSSLHPLGNLFMTPTDMNETHKEIKHYRSVLQSFGVKSFSVREILLNFCKLEELQTLGFFLFFISSFHSNET